MVQPSRFGQFWSTVKVLWLVVVVVVDDEQVKSSNFQIEKSSTVIWPRWFPWPAWWISLGLKLPLSSGQKSKFEPLCCQCRDANLHIRVSGSGAHAVLSKAKQGNKILLHWEWTAKRLRLDTGIKAQWGIFLVKMQAPKCVSPWLTSLLPRPFLQFQ